MPQRVFLLFSTTWAVALLVFGSVNFTRAMLAFHNDYYWTPTTQHEPLSDSNGRFEVYVRGKLLDRRVQDGELGLRAGESWLPLHQGDLTVRLNHIDQVTRGWLLSGVGFASAGLAWLIAVFVVRTAQKREEPRPA